MFTTSSMSSVLLNPYPAVSRIGFDVYLLLEKFLLFIAEFLII